MDRVPWSDLQLATVSIAIFSTPYNVSRSGSPRPMDSH